MPDVYSMLDVNDKNVPYTTIKNIETILENDDLYKNKLRLNQITDRWEYCKNGIDVDWTDAEENKLLGYIETNYKIFSRAKTPVALSNVFNRCSYNPIVDLIKSTDWDGISRCQTFFIKHMNVLDNEYHREVSRLIFAGGIKRFLEHGSKFDEMVVLIGKQGCGKSTIVEWLAMFPKYFGELKDFDGNKAIESVQSKCLVEVSELSALRKSEVEEMKAFISRTNDEYRRPYAKYTTPCPRRCILIGTSNKRQFLTDKTGNRRFLPMLVNSNVGYMYENINEIKNDILQCWVEMYHAYTNHLPLSNTVINSHLTDELKIHQDEALEDDFKVGLITSYLEQKVRNNDFKVCVLEIWSEVFEAFKKDLKPRDSSEISLIMQNMNGWVKSSKSMRFADFGVQKGWTYENRSKVTPFEI